MTGAGWRIFTTEPDADITPSLTTQMQGLERWLKNIDPLKLFESMPYREMPHSGIVGDALYVSQDRQGRPLEI